MKKSFSNIQSIPSEVLADIPICVASNSVSDFVNVKLTCNAFLEASKDNQIFENVLIENMSLIP